MTTQNCREISVISILLTALISLSQASCGGTGAGNPEASEDGSFSGSAAGAVGGALSNSNSSGTQAFNEPSKKATFLAKADFDLLSSAYGSSLCPTFKSSSGAGCSTNAGTLWLAYSNCSFSEGLASWNGAQALIMSAGSASCGTFPYPGSNGNLSRQYVTTTGSASAGQVTVKSSYGTQSTIDDATANLGNFDGDTIPSFINNGYGAKVGFSGGVRTSAQVAHHLSTPSFDHSVNGTVDIVELGNGSRTINGTVSVYHNVLHVVGSANFQNVGHNDACCFPVSGSIKTTFSAGSNPSYPPTTTGSAYIQGGSETLTFTGCGTGTLQAYDGTTSSVTLTRCF